MGLPSPDREVRSPRRPVAAAVEVGHRRLAGLAVRRPGHAPLHAGRRAVRGRAARRSPTPEGSVGRLVQLVDSGGVSGRLGAWRRILRRIGDRIGRSRALMLTILTYALFTGLSFFAQTWWHLLIFRFLAALGIGGEWAVGASLLSETWPQPLAALDGRRAADAASTSASCWRPSPVFLLAGVSAAYVFLVGVLPALLVLWIRRAVPETGGMARGQEQSADDAARVPRSVSRRAFAAPRVLTLLGLRTVADGPLGVHVLVSAAPAQPARS